MRRVTLTVVTLALLLSLGIGLVVGRMAGGSSAGDREYVLSVNATIIPVLGTPEPTGSGSPVGPPSTPEAGQVRRSATLVTAQVS